MAINVTLFTTNFGITSLPFFAFNPDDISFGEADTRDITINRLGNIQVVQLKKETVTFSLKGASGLDLTTLEAGRVAQLEDLIAGGTTVQADLNISGKIILAPILYRVAPTGPIIVGGTAPTVPGGPPGGNFQTLFETIEIELRSPKYT